MKTAIELADGTDKGKRQAYAQLATGAITLGGIAMAAPLITMSGGTAGLGLILGQFGGLIHIPWIKASVLASLGLYATTFKPIPRKVTSIELKPYSWMVPIGRTYRGKWVYFDFDGNIPHLKVAGATGFGKSAFLQMILYVLCQQQKPNNLTVDLIDLKGGATFAPFRRLPHVTGVYRDIEGAKKCLQEAEQMMYTRLNELEKSRGRLDDDPTFPRHIIIIDEGGELAPGKKSGEQKKIRQECMHLLSSLARIGREPRICIVYGTQRPDKDTLPMDIRSQLEAVFCFHVKEHYDSEIVLGHEGAEEIANIKGRMIFQTPDGEMPVQAAYVSQQRIYEWLSSYSDVAYKVDSKVASTSGLSALDVASDWVG